MKSIEISVIVNCYNECNFLPLAVQSILEQTFYSSIKEILIVDDGSVDETQQVVEKLKKESDKIKYLYQENQGLAEARNNGIRNSSTDYIAFIDADDTWDPTKIEKQVQCLDKYPEIGLIYTDTYALENGNKRHLHCNSYKFEDGIVLRDFFVYDGPVVPSTTFIRKKCFDEVGMFDVRFLKAQDTEMWIRIASKFHLHHIQEPLVVRRFHPTSLSSNYEKKRNYMLQVVETAISLFPELKELKRKRINMLNRQYAKNNYFKGNRFGAIHIGFKNLLLEPLNLRSYIMLIIYLIPVPSRWLKRSSKKMKF